jgi:hypothetical protein
MLDDTVIVGVFRGINGLSKGPTRAMLHERFQEPPKMRIIRPTQRRHRQGGRRPPLVLAAGIHRAVVLTAAALRTEVLGRQLRVPARIRHTHIQTHFCVMPTQAG